MTPLLVFRRVAIAEAVTWGLLLVGMFLKYATLFRDGSSLASSTTEAGEVAVRVFGMVHGVVFIGYCLVTLLVWVDQQWSIRHGVLGLVSSVPPFATVLFDRYAERRGLLDDHWHSSPETSTSLPQRVVCWLLRHHRATIVGYAGAVAGLTGLALLVGPPTS